jgi:hypothetical protein
MRDNIPMFNVETLKQLYPEMFSPTTPSDIIIGVLILSLLFVIPYLYIKFMEERVIAFLGNRLIPFIEFRLRLKKIINLVHKILEMQVFGNPRTRI